MTHNDHKTVMMANSPINVCLSRYKLRKSYPVLRISMWFLMFSFLIRIWSLWLLWTCWWITWFWCFQTKLLYNRKFAIYVRIFFLKEGSELFNRLCWQWISLQIEYKQSPSQSKNPTRRPLAQLVRTTPWSTTKLENVASQSEIPLPPKEHSSSCSDQCPIPLPLFHRFVFNTIYTITPNPFEEEYKVGRANMWWKQIHTVFYMKNDNFLPLFTCNLLIEPVV